MKKKKTSPKILLAAREGCDYSGLKSLLEKASACVDILTGREETLRKISTSDYDHYFIDIDPSRFILIDSIYRVKDRPSIVVLSAGPDLAVEREVRSRGIVYFLASPYSETEASRLISSLFRIGIKEAS